MGLRSSNQPERAKSILDAALVRHPKDENLLFQRAITARSENDLDTVLRLLPEEPNDDEARCLRADALAHQGKSDEALKLLDQFDMERASEKMRKVALAARARSYCNLGEPETALSQVGKAVQNAAADLGLRALQIDLTRQTLGEEAASKILDTALEHVASDTSLVNRMELAFEAERLNRHGDIIPAAAALKSWLQNSQIARRRQG